MSEEERLKILSRYQVSNKSKVSNPVKIEEKKEDSTVDPNLKAPVCCFLGHVDAGKTSLIDMIRKTSIQENEDGGITQTIEF